ncbi:thioredoxin family protein [Arcticibacter sp.]|jgi:thiol-disulfide isomerase/thioredoxin|uniref:thioredoxin family protein n=1 Tax=Arcticibacter sp. TaxID=1872630 RepID=UPI003890FCF9
MAFKYTHDLINQGLTYAAYRKKIVNQLAEQDSAQESVRKLLKYTAKNEGRMTAIDQSLRLIPDVLNILKDAKPVTWLVLTEGWCGDAASSIPVIAAIAAQFPDKIDLRLVFRDENPELMNAHLTNGGKSIPKLVVLDESLNFLTSWGPRPQALQDQMEVWKAEYENDFTALIRKVNSWYDEDGGVSIQKEICKMMADQSMGLQSV